MSARLARAWRCGARAALVVLLLQATAAVALAAALPEVGHVHPVGTPDHPHALLEVGGAGATAPVPPPLPRPAAARHPRAVAPRADARRPRLAGLNLRSVAPESPHRVGRRRGLPPRRATTRPSCAGRTDRRGAHVDNPPP
jgi:hypothetical protein